MPPRTKKTTSTAPDAETVNGADDTWPAPVPIGDTSVLVKHYLDWPASADDLLIAGRLHKWAEKILDGDDYATVWVPLDPTNRQVGEFLLALEKISGIPFVTSVGSPAN